MWWLPAKLTRHSDQEVSSRSERRAPRAQEWPQLRANVGGCRNTTAVTQRLLHKEKFHFCWTRQEMTYGQKYLGRVMGHLLPRCEVGGVAVVILPSQGLNISSIFKALEKEMPA